MNGTTTRVSGSEKDVFERYGLKVKTLQDWRRRHVGPPYSKPEGSVIYVFADIDAWLEKNKVTPHTS